MRWVIGVIGEEKTSARRDSDSGRKGDSERVSSVLTSSEVRRRLVQVIGGEGIVALGGRRVPRSSCGCGWAGGKNGLESVPAVAVWID